MKRIALTENGEKTGRFFDTDKATKYDEITYWNGKNHISKATGSQWNHEVLYKTTSGKWVLNCYFQYSGTVETYEIISPADAAMWFVKNECAGFPPEIADEIASLEV